MLYLKICLDEMPELVFCERPQLYPKWPTYSLTHLKNFQTSLRDFDMTFSPVLTFLEVGFREKPCQQHTTLTCIYMRCEKKKTMNFFGVKTQGLFVRKLPLLKQINRLCRFVGFP